MGEREREANQILGVGRTERFATLLVKCKKQERERSEVQTYIF